MHLKLRVSILCVASGIRLTDDREILSAPDSLVTVKIFYTKVLRFYQLTYPFSPISGGKYFFSSFMILLLAYTQCHLKYPRLDYFSNAIRTLVSTNMVQLQCVNSTPVLAYLNRNKIYSRRPNRIDALNHHNRSYYNIMYVQLVV